ncbi:hypothetical protein L2E82_19796 [Cichorium intybus]|uniref:Uncharacterized protein n=1 Tax=Cichorium intybus TaxID=13427 RepID=A0ACB9DR72_CICIN|nr:hypothetical protein L2E82_19796 [Cichorium intybus]
MSSKPLHLLPPAPILSCSPNTHTIINTYINRFPPHRLFHSANQHTKMGKGVFFTSASMLLAVIITATLRSHHHHQLPNDSSSSFTNLTTNASNLLRSNGFNFIATFLHISPDLFLSTPQTTIFAIPDTAISNLSIPPYMTKHLLAYHISPEKLTIQDLLKKSTKTCLPTLIQRQKVSITKNDHIHRVLEINNVLITYPNLFLQGPVAIHGVAGPFASFDHNQEKRSHTSLVLENSAEA